MAARTATTAVRVSALIARMPVSVLGFWLNNLAFAAGFGG